MDFGWDEFGLTAGADMIQGRLGLDGLGLVGVGLGWDGYGVVWAVWLVCG